MFGHQDEPTPQTDAPSDQSAPAAPVDSSFVVGGQNPALPPDPINFGAPAGPAGPVQLPSPAPVTDTNNLLEPQATDGFTSAPTDAPADASAAPASDTPVQDQTATVGAPGPLTDLKQQALQQLAPLVGQLEQTPEEKFRTTMMMIQASDNQDLLQAAYDAANQITDEKAKAQALLDVINEINYFSQK